jgi:hypothetical protein
MAIDKNAHTHPLLTLGISGTFLRRSNAGVSSSLTGTNCGIVANNEGKFQTS